MLEASKGFKHARDAAVCAEQDGSYSSTREEVEAERDDHGLRDM
jgi:hypothetical protein